MPTLNPNLPVLLSTLAYLITLVEVIIGLYVLYLNYHSSAYRHVSLSLVVLALNSFALGRLIVATDAAQAFLPTALLAATTPLIMSMLLGATLSLLKPSLARHAWVRPGILLLGLLGGVPVLLTLIDARSSLGLWFTPPTALNYSGGYVDKSIYTAGTLSGPLNGLIFGLIGSLLIVFLAYVLAGRQSEQPHARGIAIWLLLANVCAIVPNILHLVVTAAFLLNLAASVCYMVAFTLAAFLQPIQTRTTTGSLQTRLTVVALIITLPLLAAMGIILTDQARAALEEDAAASLAAINQNVVNASEIWMAYSARALRTLVADDAVISMNPARQAAILRNLTATYPDVYLASTTYMTGSNAARSDGRNLEDFSSSRWFQEIVAGGVPVSYQVMLDRTSHRPTLVVAMPIRKENGQIAGVAMFATELTQIQRLIAQNMSTSLTTVFMVNNDNQLIANSNPLAPLMADLSAHPAVAAIRAGEFGSLRYTDSAGIRWIAHVNILSNGWGVVTQQTEADLFAPVNEFTNLGRAILLVGALILLFLTWSTIRQSMQPVRTLTETAAAITAGDLTRSAPVIGQDELGQLAQSFNTMTAQLRDLITGLENRVSERTRDLERRAIQLQVTADVAREATAIHDPDRLLQDVTQLISERFGFYHAGIFIIETKGGKPVDAVSLDRSTLTGSYAVLRTASSEGGQRMLRRGHRLAVGREGLVGYVAASGRPRIALDVGQDAVYFNNPDLPMTRSEMALPLKLGERVIGVLDVQSRTASAFSQEDVAILQILADQLAVSIENARLIETSRQSLREMESLYGMQLQQGWQKRLGNQPLVYRLEGGRVRPETTEAPALPPDDAAELEIPIELRGLRLGALRLRRDGDRTGWSQQEIELARETVAHMAQALENARLVAEIENRATQEEQINQIVARTQSTLGLDSVMRTAVQEIVRVANVSRVQIRLGGPAADAAAPDPTPAGPANGNGGAE